MSDKIKDYTDPKKEDLREGNILPIYEDYKQQKKFLGHAMLLKYSPSWRDELPYVRKEIGNTDRDPITINWAYERWKVQFVDGELKDFVTCKYIAYFLCIDNYLYSGYRMSADEDI